MATELQTVTASHTLDRSGADSDHTLIALWLRGRRSAHARDVAAFQEYAGQPALNNVTVTMVQAWVEDLAAALAPTVARKLASLESLLAFAATTGYLPYNVGAAVQATPRWPPPAATRMPAWGRRGLSGQVGPPPAATDPGNEPGLLLQCPLAYLRNAPMSAVASMFAKFPSLASTVTVDAQQP